MANGDNLTHRTVLVVGDKEAMSTTPTPASGPRPFNSTPLTQIVAKGPNVSVTSTRATVPAPSGTSAALLATSHDVERTSSSGDQSLQLRQPISSPASSDQDRPVPEVAAPRLAPTAANASNVGLEETTVVADVVALNARLERVLAATSAVDADEVVTQLASMSAARLDLDEVTRAVASTEDESAEEATSVLQNIAPPTRRATAALPATSDAALSRIQSLAAAAAAQAEPPLVRTEDLSSEFATESATDKHQAPLEPSALVELSKLLASNPPPAAPKVDASLKERVSEVADIARSATDLGLRQSRKAYDTATHWLREQSTLNKAFRIGTLSASQLPKLMAPRVLHAFHRLEQVRIGRMRFVHMAASAGAVLVVLVLLVFVGSSKPAPMPARAAMEGSATSSLTKASATRSNVTNNPAGTGNSSKKLLDEQANGVADEEESEEDVASSAASDQLSEARKLVSAGNKKMRQNRLRFAEEDFRAALNKVPRYPLALQGLTRVHLARKDGKTAVHWASMLVKRQPIRSENFLLLGDAYALRANMSAAKQAWQRAAKAGNKTAATRLKARK